MRIVAHKPHQQLDTLMPAVYVEAFLAHETVQVPKNKLSCCLYWILEFRSRRPLYRNFISSVTIYVQCSYVPKFGTIFKDYPWGSHSTRNMRNEWCVFPIQHSVNRIVNAICINMVNADAEFPCVSKAFVFNNGEIHIQ